MQGTGCRLPGAGAGCRGRMLDAGAGCLRPGLGCRVWSRSPRAGPWVLVTRCRVSDFRSRSPRAGSWVQVLRVGHLVPGAGCRGRSPRAGSWVLGAGFGCRSLGAGFRVLGCGLDGRRVCGGADAGRVFGGRRVVGSCGCGLSCLAIVGLCGRGSVRLCSCAAVRFVGRARHADAVFGRLPGWYGCGHDTCSILSPLASSCPAGYDSSGCEHPFPHRAGRGLSAVMWLHGCVRHTVLFCPILPAFWLVSSGCEHPSPPKRGGMFFRSVGCGIAGLRGETCRCPVVCLSDYPVAPTIPMAPSGCLAAGGGARCAAVLGRR